MPSSGYSTAVLATILLVVIFLTTAATQQCLAKEEHSSHLLRRRGNDNFSSVPIRKPIWTTHLGGPKNIYGAWTGSLGPVYLNSTHGVLNVISGGSSLPEQSTNITIVRFADGALSKLISVEGPMADPIAVDLDYGRLLVSNYELAPVTFEFQAWFPASQGPPVWVTYGWNCQNPIISSTEHVAVCQNFGSYGNQYNQNGLFVMNLYQGPRFQWNITQSSQQQQEEANEIYGAVMSVDGHTLYVTVGKSTKAFEIRSGKLMWEVPTLVLNEKPVVTNVKMVCTKTTLVDARGQIISLPSGKIIFSPRPGAKKADVIAQAVIIPSSSSSEFVVLATTASALTCFDVATGKVRWRRSAFLMCQNKNQFGRALQSFDIFSVVPYQPASLSSSSSSSASPTTGRLLVAVHNEDAFNGAPLCDSYHAEIHVKNSGSVLWNHTKVSISKSSLPQSRGNSFYLSLYTVNEKTYASRHRLFQVEHATGREEAIFETGNEQEGDVAKINVLNTEQDILYLQSGGHTLYGAKPQQ